MFATCNSSLWSRGRNGTRPSGSLSASLFFVSVDFAECECLSQFTRSLFSSVPGSSSFLRRNSSTSSLCCGFWGVWEQQPAAEGNVSKRKATTYSSYAATDLLMFPIWFRGLIKLFATDRIKEWKYKLGFSQNQVKVLIQIFTFEFVSYNYQESWWFCSFRSYSTARPALNT